MNWGEDMALPTDATITKALKNSGQPHTESKDKETCSPDRESAAHDYVVVFKPIFNDIANI